MPVNTDWRSYPFRLVHNDSALDFPAAEGEHAYYESDTWFLAGELTGTTGRKFAFLTIFNKNRPGGKIVADFYTFALFDWTTAHTGHTPTTTCHRPTCVRRRSPNCPWPSATSTSTTKAGHRAAAWRTCRDDHGD